MKLETDLNRISKIAEMNENQNWKFRTYLKNLDIDDDELDAIVHGLNDEISAQIDCTECGNCCREIRPGLEEEDITRFAIGLEMPIAEFSDLHLKQVDDRPNEFTFKGLPCQFLDDNKCSHYELRPASCSSFPHLHKSNFRGRLISVVWNYETCPIVFNVYERLKAELWR